MVAELDSVVARQAEYDGKRGQPAIHPRYVAAGILYGLCRGIRSRRKLEEACSCRWGFIWLLEGRQIDPTTLAKFRRFLLRGLPKVKTEWRWAVTAFNLTKLVKEAARMRTELMDVASVAEK